MIGEWLRHGKRVAEGYCPLLISPRFEAGV